jgi:hypothetical protein
MGAEVHKVIQNHSSEEDAWVQCRPVNIVWRTLPMRGGLRLQLGVGSVCATELEGGVFNNMLHQEPFLHPLHAPRTPDIFKRMLVPRRADP